MTSDRKWNVEDVQRLVEAATNILDPGRAESNGYRCIGLESITADYLRDALAPFQPDPDAELVETVRHLRESHPNYPEHCRAIIAAVRDHDAKAVSK